MLYWAKIEFNKLVKLSLPTFLRKRKTIAFLVALVAPMQKLHDDTLYTMQHDGRKIYLEKVLNDYFQVAGYDASDHENTKTVYIGNVDLPGDVFVFQPAEDEPVFLGDSTNSEEVFINQEDETLSEYSFTVFIPDTYTFNEPTVRALIDKYRFIGKLYNIETYTL